jgi:hypothetical protein
MKNIVFTMNNRITELIFDNNITNIIKNYNSKIMVNINCNNYNKNYIRTIISITINKSTKLHIHNGLLFLINYIVYILL